ncbi:putative hrq family protein 4 [Diplodia corticola]|uniref:Putative hrq family protein 4 n=1 Tax=Diplodia corticola TaxID=236234 RepID=A0A1J9RT20_9PEZI|nr:putative hrq family protein 4 [Diplodia corticola]OJD30677.1 putative hrq family protein 4 [Diplodia corticola]
MPTDTQPSLLHGLSLPLPLHSIPIVVVVVVVVVLVVLVLIPLFLHHLQRHPIPSPAKPNKNKNNKPPTTNPDTTNPDTTTPTPAPAPCTPNPLAAPPDAWYRDRSLLARDKTYTPTMALRRCPPDDWLRIDANYPARIAHKRNVLRRHGWDPKGGAMAWSCRLSGVQAPEEEEEEEEDLRVQGAVVELLGVLVGYLVGRFPTVWVGEGEGEGGGRVRWLRSLVTGERFEVVEPWGGLSPLEVVARVTEEDLAVLLPGRGEGEGDEDEDEYVLMAAVSAFPAGFDIQEKMGRPLTAIHEPVPMYKEKLRKAMNRFFKKMTADRLVMRVNWGINEREELFFLDGTHLYEGDEASSDENIDINQVQLRVERQVLRRLPRSGAICMLTKTYLYRLVDIAEEPGVAERLSGMLHKLPEKFAFYKRKPVWGKVVLAYLDEMAAKYPDLAANDE